MILKKIGISFLLILVKLIRNKELFDNGNFNINNSEFIISYIKIYSTKLKIKIFNDEVFKFDKLLCIVKGYVQCCVLLVLLFDFSTKISIDLLLIKF